MVSFIDETAVYIACVGPSNSYVLMKRGISLFVHEKLMNVLTTNLHVRSTLALAEAS